MRSPGEKEGEWGDGAPRDRMVPEASRPRISGLGEG